MQTLLNNPMIKHIRQVVLLSIMLCEITLAHAIAPTISSFGPASGAVGTLVTISGSNLISPTTFTIGGSNAIVVSNTGSTLVGMVMPGAVTGAISVTTAGGTATASGSFTVTATLHPGIQQGPKLVGTGYVAGDVQQGYSVAISADGNTAIVGGYKDNSDTGAVWIYTRTGTTWAQQGPKLVAPDGGASYQGSSVALSADGNIAMVGGSYGNGGTGGSWIWLRSGGVWTLQGPKLLGTGTTGNAYQGASVSLSADGSTALVGGASDNTGAGAVWIFVRSGNNWIQQGPKLVGTGAVGKARQGFSASLSADGNTAIVGGWDDNGAVGAAWIWTRTDTTWSQQGPKLIGAGATTVSYQGYSVDISADGNTAVVGGYAQNAYRGATWVFTRTNNAWSQQGPMLVAYDTTAWAHEGFSVAISGDGNTIIAGGLVDSNSTGATWTWTRTGTTWTQQGPKIVGTGATGHADQGSAVALSADGGTAIVGGYHDNYNNVIATGAVWIFVSACTAVVTPSVSIAITSGSQSTCSGSSVTFTANGSNGGSAPHYQWYKNGTALPADTNTTYTSSALANNDSIWCVMTSTIFCTSSPTAVSAAIHMTVGQTVTPTISVSAPQPNVCRGDYEAYVSTITNGGSTPSYQWVKNGINVGTNSSAYAAPAVSSADSVWCILTSNAACATPTTVTSNKAGVSILPAPSPVVVMQGADTLYVTAAFTTYQWLYNNIVINSGYGRSYVATQNGSYRVVVTNSYGCKDTSVVMTVSNVGIDDIASSDMRIYPNPAENVIHVDADKLHNNTNLVIIDALGRNVYEKKIDGDNIHETIDISSLAPSMYILILKDQDKVYVSRRLIKE